MDTKDPKAEQNLLRDFRAPGEEAGRNTARTGVQAGERAPAQTTEGRRVDVGHCTCTLRAAKKRKARGGEMGDAAGEGSTSQRWHRCLLMVQGCPHSSTLTVQTQGSILNTGKRCCSQVSLSFF